MRFSRPSAAKPVYTCTIPRVGRRKLGQMAALRRQGPPHVSSAAAAHVTVSHSGGQWRQRWQRWQRQQPTVA
jgi:hypothetical protein